MRFRGPSRFVAVLSLLAFCAWPLLSFGQTYPVLSNRWAFPLGGRSDSSPAIGKDGALYFGSWTGRLFALTGEGKEKWIFSTRSRMEIVSSPALAPDGTVYFGSRDRRFYAVDAHGRLKWSFPTGAWVDSSPALARDGTVYFGSWDKRFYALNADGAQKWSFETQGPIVSSPAIGLDGTIYFGSHDGKFYALDAGGKKQWEFSTGGPIISSPALTADGGLYITSVDGGLYALQRDGSLRWRLQTGGMTASSPVISGDGAVFLGVNNELWLVGNDGKQVWARANESLIEMSPVAFDDLSACYIHGWGGMLDLDRERMPRWSFFFEANPTIASPAVSDDGVLYACGTTNRFLALETVPRLARSSWPRFRGNPQNTGNLADSRL